MLLPQWHFTIPLSVRADKYYYDYYGPMSKYQLGHSREHFGQADEALGLLEEAYRKYEDADNARMAGWAALFRGRCLRQLDSWTDAEDWMLASVVIFASVSYKRGIGYALAEWFRHRAMERRLATARWFLEQGQAVWPAAFGRMVDDVRGEPTIRSLRCKVQSWPKEELENLAASDPAVRIVGAVLARISSE